MNFSTFWQQPVPVRLVQIISVLILVSMIVMTVIQLSSPFQHGSVKSTGGVALKVLPLLIWAGATIGVFKVEKWGWAMTCGIVTFSFLGSVNFLLSQYGGAEPALIVSLVCSAGFIVLLHRRDILQQFKTHLFKENEYPLELTPFAVVCIAGGLFLFMEFFTASRIGPGSLIPKLFVSGLGVVFILLGYGLYRVNKTALQSALAIFIFTFMSAIIIFTRDFFSKRHYFPLPKAIFYIALAAVLLFFWRRVLRTKLAGVNRDVEE